jgi:hypothetical protein
MDGAPQTRGNRSRPPQTRTLAQDTLTSEPTEHSCDGIDHLLTVEPSHLSKKRTAIRVWIVANPDEGYALSKPAVGAVRAAERAFHRPLPPRVRWLAELADGQPFPSKGFFGGCELLALAGGAREYATELKVRTKVADPGY